MAYTISTNGIITVTSDTEDLFTILSTEQPTNGTSANTIVRDGDTSAPIYTVERIVINQGATLTFRNATFRTFIVQIRNISTNTARVSISGNFEYGFVQRDANGNPTTDVRGEDYSNSLIFYNRASASQFDGDEGLTVQTNGTVYTRGGTIGGAWLGLWQNTPNNAAFDFVGTNFISNRQTQFRVHLSQAAAARSRIVNCRMTNLHFFPGGPVEFTNLELNRNVVMNLGSDTRTFNLLFDNLVLNEGANWLVATNASQAPSGSTVYLRNGQLTYPVRSRQNNSGTSRGTVITNSLVTYRFRDALLNPIVGAQFRAQDTNSGSRRNSAESDNATDTWTGDPVIHHWNRDLIFEETTDEGGNINLDLPKTIYNSTLTSTQTNTNAWVADSRLPYTYQVRHYNYTLVDSEITATDFIIGGNTTIFDTVSEDLDLTSNVTVAANITGITFDKANAQISVTSSNTLDNLYDHWKWWFVQLEQFDIDPFVVTGSTFDIDDWDVTGAELLSTGTKITTIKTTGNVTGTGQITVSFLDSTLSGQIELIISELPEGNFLNRRVIVTRKDTNPHEELFDNRYNGTQGSSTTHTFTTNFTQSIPVDVKVISDDWKTFETSLTLLEGRNFLSMEREITYGLDGTGVRASYQINNLTTGFEINTNSNTAIYTANSTIVVGGNPNTDANALIPLRQAISDAKYSWARNDELGGANISPPFDLDDVRGLSVSTPWTINTLANIKTEGWFRRFPTDGTISQVNFLYTIENSAGNVRSYLVYDGVEQDPFYMSGNTTIMTRVLPIDITAANVRLRASQKVPDKVFLFKDFSVRDPATTRYLNNLTNGDTNFSVQDDINVTENLADNPSLRGRLANVVVVQDSDGISHTFTEILEVQNGTDTRQKLINELAAIAAYDDYYTEKPYTLQANLRVDLPSGTFVRLKNGGDLVGEVTGFVGIFSNNSGQYGFPTQRLMTLKLVDSYISGSPVSYVVTRTDSVGIDGTEPNIINGSMYGNLSTDSRSVTLGVNSATNVEVTIHYFGSNIQFGTATGIISSEVSLVEISPISEPIQLYKNQAQTVDNDDAGTRAWDTNINNISFNWADREIIIPNNYTVFDVSKAYRAWRNELESNSLRAIYGHAIRGVNQGKQVTISGNTHLYSPLLYFNDSWSLDVDPTRPTSSALQLAAGDLQREDQEHFGLVYNSPLAVNIKPSFSLVQGVTTDFESCTSVTLGNISSEITGNITTFVNYISRVIRSEIE